MKSEQSDTASVRYENTELLHHAFGSVGGSCTKQNPTLNFRADYIEHHFEARAMLPPIFDALCNRLFLFAQIEPQRQYILKIEWPSEWDMSLRWYERSNVGVRLPGRNDIRVKRQNQKYGKMPILHFGKNAKNEKAG